MLPLLLITVPIIAVIAVLYVAVNSNPLRRSEEQIRESMFEHTPMGMTLDDVVSLIDERDDWSLRNVNERIGYSFLMGRPGDPSGGQTDNIIGKKYVAAYIGEYQSFFKTTVGVFWAFDENSELIEIAVIKYVHGM